MLMAMAGTLFGAVFAVEHAQRLFANWARALTTVTLNSGATTVGIGNDITAQADLVPDIGAYQWTVNGANLMALNVPFNTGATQMDFSGNARHGTTMDTTAYTSSSCQVGGCLALDGTGDGVRVEAVPISPLGNFTIEAWIKPSSLVSAPALFAEGTDADFYPFFMFRVLGDGTLTLHARNDASTEIASTASSNGTVTAGAWNHVAVTKSGTAVTFYINGLASSVTYTLSGTFNNLVHSNIGILDRDDLDNAFSGTMDEVRIYNRALTSAEVQHLYGDGNAGVGGPTIIDTFETVVGDVWNLTVTAIDASGVIGSAVGSSNTVTVGTPSGAVSINGGAATLDTQTDLTSSTGTLLGPAQGAFTWTIGGSGLSNLNLPFNSGATQTDYSGNAVNASVTGATYQAVTTGNCLVGGCYSFDGSGDIISTGQTTATLMTNTHGSISVWYKPTGATTTAAAVYNGQSIVSDTSSYVGLHRTSVGGLDRLWAYNWDGNPDTVGATYVTDVWTHLVWVHGGGRVWLYKDGALVGSSVSDRTQVMTGTIRIGGAGAESARGYIDEVQVFDFALSPEQISQMYADGLAGLAGPTVIQAEETGGGQEWGLTVTPFAADGAAYAPVASGNTATIDIYAVTVGLNNGTTSLSTSLDLESQLTGLWEAQGAYTWTRGGTGLMTLNMPFNAGATQYNYSGSGVNGSASNGGFSREEEGICQVGGCMTFSTVGFVNTNQVTSALITASEGTMSVWVKPTGASTASTNVYNGQAIIADSGSFMGIYRTNLSGTDRIWAFNWDGNPDVAGATYTTDVWTHIVWVHGGGRLSVYKDGVLASSAISSNTTVVGNDVDIGAAGGTKIFSGMIDEVQTFNVALSAAQIARLYADGAAHNAAPTVVVAQETSAAEIWDLDFTPFDSGGVPLAPVASGNTVTIAAPTVTVGLANGATTLTTDAELTAQVTGLGEAQGAYTWLVDAAPFMTVNVPFNSGATQFNYNGGGVHGTNTAASFSPQGQGLCQIGGCMSFDGTTSFVDLSLTTADVITASEGTVSAWVRPIGVSPTETRVLDGNVAVGDGLGYFGISRATVGGLDRLWVFNWDGNEDSVGATYTVDAWTHIVWVHGGGRLTMYKDGVLVGATASSNTEILSGGVDIGQGSSAATRFEGLIDDVQIYNTALSAAQIEQLYEDGAANLAGPTAIVGAETTSNEVWDLEVVPLEGNGSVFPAVESVNTVTIVPPVLTVTLNNGTSLVSTYVDVTTQVTGLTEPQGAFTWTINGSDYMSLNMPFNSGATQTDFSGSGVNGTVSGAAFSKQGQGLCQVGGCMSFDGATTSINTNRVTSSIISATEGTLSIWAYPTGSAPTGTNTYHGQALIADTGGFTGLYRTDIGGLDRVWAFNWDGTDDRVGTTYSVDAWNHFVWVHQGGILSIYKDGAFVGSTTSGSTASLGTGVHIGVGNGGGEVFNGLLDEVQAYPTALSAEEIAQVYADGLANLAGPTQIPSEATEPGQTWDVDVTPFEGDGSVFSATSSTNTVTIDAPTVTVTLNNGVLFAADADPVPAQVTGLGSPQGAYTWTVDASPWMALNLPFNAGAQLDYSGNNLGVTLGGNAGFTASACKVGGCLGLDGDNDYAVINDAALFNNLTGLTIAAWVKNSTLPYAVIVGDRFEGSIWESVLLTTDTFILNTSNDGGTRTTVNYTPITDGLWHHVAAVWDGDDMLVYIDGALDGGPTPFNATPYSSAQLPYVGAFNSFVNPPTESEINGAVDELQIYRHGLSANEVQQLYADGNANLAGPTTIAADETVLGQVWDLSVTPFESDGSAYPAADSANTVSILNNSAPDAPTVPFAHNTNAQLGNSNPGGIDTTPVFSAIFNDADTGNTASEYRIQVDDNNDFSSPLWDSGAAGTAISACAINTRCENINYAGDPLSLGGITYYWRIKFWDNWGSEGAFSATAQFTTDQTPTAPTSLFSNDATAQAGLTNPVGILASRPVFSAVFNDPDLADVANKYRIQVDDDNDFSSLTWDSGAAGTNMATCDQGDRCADITFDGTPLPLDGSLYYWRIKFWDEAGVESPWSEDPVSTNTFTMGISSGGTSIQRIQQQQQQDQEAQEEVVPTVPAAPIAGSVEVLGPDSVRYNWIDTSDNETGFRILNAEGQVIVQVEAGATQAVETGLPANMPVEGRRVIAFNDVGPSEASEFVSAITAAPIVRPVLQHRNGDSVTFTIEPVVTSFPGETAVRYEVLVTDSSVPGQAPEVRTLTSDWIQSTQYEFIGIEPEDNVQVRVVTRNQEGLQNEPTQYEEVAKLSRRFHVTIGVFEKGSDQLTRPVDPRKTLSVSMQVESIGTDAASSVIINLPLPRYIRYRSDTLSVDGRPKNDAVDGDGGNADNNGVSASWARMNPGESHTVTFELAFDVPALDLLRQTSGQAIAAANPLINLQASVSFAESDVVYMSPVITLEPDITLAQVPVEPEVQLPTPEETQVIEQILQEEFGSPTPAPAPSPAQPSQPGEQPSAPAPAPLQRGETNVSSDNGTFNLTVDGDSLSLTGSAEVTGEILHFSGTTTEPFTIVTLIFNDSITAIAVSDAEGNWQTFVDADRLGIAPGQDARVKIEAIAAKGDLRSQRVQVGDVVVSRGRSGDIEAEFDSTVSDSAFLSVAEEIQHQVVKVIEKQEPVIQTTLSVAAPVVMVSSVPLWGYLPYVPTLLYHAITYLIGIAGRKKRLAAHFYGVVYDSITKQPLALAIIRIYKTEPTLPGAANVGAAAATNKKLVTTVVTDKLGRYDALLEPGTYQLEVAKPSYLFPSQIVRATIDGDFQNVYSAASGVQVQGDQITIPDVPLDPVNAQRQWQLATGFKKVRLAIQRVGNYLAAPILIVGSVSSAAVVATIPDKPINWVIAAFYIVLLVLQLRLRDKVEKAWGVVYDIATNAVLPLTTIQLIEPTSSKVVTSRLSDYQGRFAFLPEPGTYVVKATKPGYQQVSEVVEAPQTDRQPLGGEIKIEKADQRVTGDIAMRQAT